MFLDSTGWVCTFDWAGGGGGGGGGGVGEEGGEGGGGVPTYHTVGTQMLFCVVADVCK